jgi:hypothetical protein
MDGAVIPNNVRGEITMANFAGVLKELQQERRRLDQVILVIGNLVGQNRTGIRTKPKRLKRTLSAAARSKISLAQKARWAKTRRTQASTPVHTMSQAARKKIGAAQRARWAKTRAQQKKAA